MTATGLTISGYNNTATSTESHNYEDGFCTLCGGYQPANLNGDVYEIANAGQLFWFAALVNGDKTHAEFDSQNSAANAKLLNDITLNENVLNADGELNGDGSGLRVWTPMGSDSNRYVGTFDGNGHTIYGLISPAGEAWAWWVTWAEAAFCRESRWQTDMCVPKAAHTQAASVLGTGAPLQIVTTVPALWAGAKTTSAASVGCNEDGGIIRDCTNSGRIQGVQKVGGIVGWNYLAIP